MLFQPKFASSYRNRIVILAIVLSINAFVAIHQHYRNAFGAVILAAAAVLSAAIPESPTKVTPERYPLSGDGGG